MPIKTNHYPITFEHETYRHDNFVATKMPPIENLNYLFRYDSNEGKLYRIRDAIGRRYNLEMTNMDSKKQYYRVDIVDSYGKEREFQVHRIIWFMHTGQEPVGQVDHLDGNMFNNKIENLRVVDNATNQRNRRMLSNNTSGITGVSKVRSGKYKASIGVDGKRIVLGEYPTIEEATIARIAALQTANAFLESRGFTERHGLSAQ